MSPNTSDPTNVIWNATRMFSAPDPKNTNTTATSVASHGRHSGAANHDEQERRGDEVHDHHERLVRRVAAHADGAPTRAGTRASASVVQCWKCARNRSPTLPTVRADKKSQSSWVNQPWRPQNKRSGSAITSAATKHTSARRSALGAFSRNHFTTKDRPPNARPGKPAFHRRQTAPAHPNGANTLDRSWPRPYRSSTPPPGGDDPSSDTNPRYRPHLDGLRAVAVYLVLLFHAGCERFSGGFIGVDVFFVLSGYLVTQLLLRDLASRGSVRLRPLLRAPLPTPAARRLRGAPRHRHGLLGDRVAVQRAELDQRVQGGVPLRVELVLHRSLDRVLRRQHRAEPGAALLVAGRRGAVLPALAARPRGPLRDHAPPRHRAARHDLGRGRARGGRVARAGRCISAPRARRTRTSAPTPAPTSCSPAR